MSDLLPRQRPNLSLSLKYKAGTRAIKALALHEACHALVWFRHGESVLDLNLADTPPATPYGGSIPLAEQTRYYARVTLTDSKPRKNNIAGGLAGAVSNELCGMGDALSIEGDVQQALFSALASLAKTVRVVDMGERLACSIDPSEPIDRNEVFATLRTAWREAIETVTEPHNFGAVHAIANAALKHSRLDIGEIRRLIETAQPFTSALLQNRRDYVLAKVPAIWESEAARLIENQMSVLNWK